MKTIFKYLCIFSTIAVAVTQTYGNIGDEESKILSDNSKLEHKQIVIDEGRVTIHSFIDHEYIKSVAILDGKSEAESFLRLDTEKIPTVYVITEVTRYTENWIPTISREADTHAMISEDGELMAVYTRAKSINNAYILMIFSQKWHDYAKAYMAIHKQL